ncbi:hypothetical protein Tco_1553143, partial [Tanacetum coccineum]
MSSSIPDSLEVAQQSPGPEHPPSPYYVHGPKHPPSPDYVPSPEHPPSPIYVPEYIEDDDDDESFDDDDDDDNDVEEDEEDEEDEEGDKHLALADPSTVPVVDPVLSAWDTEAFETDESAPTPPSPRPRRDRISVRLLPPMAASIEARIVVFPLAPTPLSPPPSLLSPWSSPLPQIPSPLLPLPSPPTSSTYVKAPLGYRAVEIRMRATSPPLLLLTTSHRTDIPKAEMTPRRRAFLTTPAFGFEVRESSATGAARQPGPTLEADFRRDRVWEIGYGITDTWDEIDTDEFYVQFEDAQDDRAFLRAPVNTLFKDRPYHRHTVMLLDREATYARRAWASSEDRSAAIEAH